MKMNSVAAIAAAAAAAAAAASFVLCRVCSTPVSL
jgi:hypothetical protein